MATSNPFNSRSSLTTKYGTYTFFDLNALTRAKIGHVEKLPYSIKVLLESKVRNITDKAVSIEQKDNTLDMKNDAVIVCAGGILPTPFLKELGILVQTKHGTE